MALGAGPCDLGRGLMDGSDAHDLTTHPRDDVRTLLVDDSQAFLDAAADVVGATRGFTSVGAVSSPSRALELLVSRRPGLAVVDVHMPQMDGIELTRRIKALRPATAVMLISAHAPDELPPGAHSCGADLVLDKREFGPSRLRELASTLAGSGPA